MWKALTLCKDWEKKRDDRVHDPVRGRAEALALGSDAVGEDLCDVDPDDGSLGDREEEDVADEEPD